MAEFKIKPALLFDINNASVAASSISSSYSKVPSDEVKTLKTAVAIIEQHAEIKQLLDLYKVLLRRDINDLKEMMKETYLLDAAIAGSIRL